MPAPASGCPYQGLLPYDVDDADCFFGRDDELRAGLEILRDGGRPGRRGRVRQREVVAGAGRRRGRTANAPAARWWSSRPDDARCWQLRRAPGPAPGRPSWSTSARRCSRCATTPRSSADFLLALVQHATRAPLVVALRGDRLGDVSAYPVFARLVEQGLLLLGAADEEALREAVEGPARQSGLRVEPGLADLLVREVEGEPGALPLLSHALQETWKRREGRTLTAAGYSASGGIRNAVAQSAERVYTDSGPGRATAAARPGAAARDARAGRRAGAQPGAEPDGRERAGPGPPHRPARVRRGSSRATTAWSSSPTRHWPALAPARGLAAGRRRGPALLHHLTSAADAWRLAGAPRQRALPRHPPRPGGRVAGARRSVLTPGRRPSWIVPRRRAAASACRTGPGPRPGEADPAVEGGARRGAWSSSSPRVVARLPRRRSRGRAEDNAAAAVGRPDRRRGSTGRARGAGDGRHRRVDAAGGRRGEDGRLTGDPQQPAGDLARHPELIASTQLAGLPDHPLRRESGRPHRRHLRQAPTTCGSTRSPTGALCWRTTRPGRAPPLVAGRAGAFSPDGQTLAVCDGGARPGSRSCSSMPATLEPEPVQPGGLAMALAGPRTWPSAATGATWRPPCGASRARGTPSDDQRTGSRLGPGGAARRPIPIRAGGRHPGRRAERRRPDPGHDRSRSTLHDLASGTPHSGGRGRARRTDRDEPERSAAGRLRRTGRAGAARRRGPASYDGGSRAPRTPAGSSASPPTGSRVATVTFENREASSGRSRAVRCWNGCRSARAGRSSTSARTAQPSTRPGPAARCGTGTSTAIDASCARVAARKPGSDRARRASPSRRPVVNWSRCTSEEPRSRFFDVELPRDAPPASSADQGYAPRRGSWHPDGVHYAHVTGGRGPGLERAPGRAGREGPDRRELHHRARLQQRRQPSGDGRAVRPGVHAGRGHPEPGGHARRELDEPVLLRLGRARQPHGRRPHRTPGRVRILARLHHRVGHGRPRSRAAVLDRGELAVNGRQVDFSPDGRYAAVAAAGRGGAGAGPRDRRSAAAPGGRADDAVLVATYSADGERILASGADSTVGLLDGDTGQLIARARTPDPLNTAGFGEDSTSVLIAPHGDGPVYEWDTDGDHALEFACRVAGRDLTEDEWADTFGDRPYRSTCPDQG